MLPEWKENSFAETKYLDGGICYVSINGYGKFDVGTEPNQIPQGAGQRFDEYLDSDLKVFLVVQKAFFHFITETVAAVLREIDEAEERGERVHIILVQPDLGEGDDERGRPDYNHINQVVRYVAGQITKRGHMATLTHLSSGLQAKVSNFKTYDGEYDVSLSVISGVADFLELGLDGLDVEPSRKIYLSRRKTLSNSTFEPSHEDLKTLDIEQFRAKYQYKVNDRIDNEEALEKYLAELGFEIISPEDVDTFEDQIRLMASCKMVASLTSASLTSTLFMKPGAVVVELLTPLVVPMGEGKTRRSIHPHYYHFAYERGLTYMSIPHERKTEEVVGLIEGNPSLKKFLSD